VKVLYALKPTDLLQLIVTFVVVVTAGISTGLLVGLGWSLATILFRSFLPRLTELGRLPRTDIFVALDRYYEARAVPGVLILRVDGELHFGNISSLTDRLFLEKELSEKKKRMLKENSQTVIVNNVVSNAAKELARSNSVIGMHDDSASVVMSPLWKMNRSSSEIHAKDICKQEQTASSMGNASIWSCMKTKDSSMESTSTQTKNTLSPVPLSNTTQSESTLERKASLESITEHPRSVYALAFFSEVEDSLAGLLENPTSTNTKDLEERNASTIANKVLDTSSVSKTETSRLVSVSHVLSSEAEVTGTGVLPIVPNHAFSTTPSNTCVVGLQAIILDASRVVDIDATAYREMQSVLETFAKKDSTVKLLIAGLPGPVRDTLDRVTPGIKRAADPASWRFLNVAAALASLRERERECEKWESITEDLALLARGETPSLHSDLTGQEVIVKEKLAIDPHSPRMLEHENMNSTISVFSTFETSSNFLTGVSSVASPIENIPEPPPEDE
jgi:STAS domain